MTDVKKLLSKVPEITIYFWIIKILCTTVGETAADYLNMTLGFGLTNTTYVMGAILIAFLVAQFRMKKYNPSIYWMVAVLLSVVGTLITDNLSDNLGVSLIASTIGFSTALAITFFIWYKSEKTLSIHSIRTSRRESFYWLAILFTFALGTAGGDLVAEQFAVGYFSSVLIFASVIAIITFAHYKLKLDAVLAFWLAYILTRPLGASIGDFMSQPLAVSGLNLGTIGTSVIFLTLIAALVVYLTYSKVDLPKTMKLQPIEEQDTDGMV
jgi:uncharacterized membrane-anchored protein